MEPIDGTSPDGLTRSVKAHDVNCTPWSEWTITPGWGSRLAMAMPSALVTRAAVWLKSIDHPTTRRQNVSNTTAQ